MLNDLKVVNGTISPDFNPNITEYEVLVDDSVISLVLEYKVDDDKTVTVYGNNFSSFPSHVLIEVADDLIKTYTLTVLTEKSEQVFLELEPEKETSKDISVITTPLLIGTMIFTIVMLFSVIFRVKVK